MRVPYATTGLNKIPDSVSDGTHTTLSYQLHGDSRLRVYVLEVEDELSQILDTVDIVMRWSIRQP